MKIFEQIIYSCCSYGLVFLLSLTWSKEQVGIFAQIAAFSVLVNIVGVGLIYGRGLIDYFSAINKIKYKLMLNELKLFFIPISILMGMMYWLLYISKYEVLTDNIIADSVIFAVYLASGVFYEFYRRDLYIDKNPNSKIYYLTVIGVLKLILVYIFAQDLFSLIITLTTLNLLFFRVSASAFIRMKRRVLIHLRKSYALVLSNVIGFCIQYAPVYFIAYKFGLTDLGVFFGIKTIANGANVFMEYLENWLPVSMSNKKNAGDVIKTEKLIAYGFLAWILIGGLLMCFCIFIYFPIVLKIDEVYGVKILTVLWLAVFAYFSQRVIALKSRVDGLNLSELSSAFFTLCCVLTILIIYPSSGPFEVAFLYLLIPIIQLILLRCL